jgi:hypothetical protein
MIHFKLKKELINGKKPFIENFLALISHINSYFNLSSKWHDHVSLSGRASLNQSFFNKYFFQAVWESP